MTDLSRALVVLADARQLVALAQTAQADAAHYRLMFHAALAALHVAVTEPTRYERIARELAAERIDFVAAAMGEDRAQAS